MNSKSQSKNISKEWLLLLMSFLLLMFTTAPVAQASTTGTSPVKKTSSTAELDQMLAPIALYPDGLLIQVMVAATYPGEVADAGRWLVANPNLTGENAITAAEGMDWNVSVKSLLAFPDVIQMMSNHMDWTVSLGNAFNHQREAVMERIQFLRQKAQAAGNLKSDEKMNVVTTTTNHIVLEPASTTVVYVPYYNPVVVYGTWWWPGYQPFFWSPWPRYVYYPGVFPVGIIWNTGIWFSYTRFYGRADWHHKHVHWNPPPHHRAPHRSGHVNRPWSSAPGGSGGRHMAAQGSNRPDQVTGRRSGVAHADNRSGDSRASRHSAARGRFAPSTVVATSAIQPAVSQSATRERRQTVNQIAAPSRQTTAGQTRIPSDRVYRTHDSQYTTRQSARTESGSTRATPGPAPRSSSENYSINQRSSPRVSSPAPSQVSRSQIPSRPESGARSSGGSRPVARSGQGARRQ